MANTPVRLAGPTALGTGVANVFNESSVKILTLVRQIHIANETTSPAKASVWLGATGASAAGTAEAKDETVAANSHMDLWYPTGLPMKSTDFLTGKSDTASALTITVVGDQQVIP